MRRLQNPLVLAVLACCLALAACQGAQEPARRTVSFRVEGMHCDNCVQSIQGNVAKLEGVESVQASFEEGSASVSFNPQVITGEEIRREIESLGFTVPGELGNPSTTPAQDSAQPSQQEDGASATDVQTGDG